MSAANTPSRPARPAPAAPAYNELTGAIRAVAAGQRDGDAFRPGGLDVLAQHVMAAACARPFNEAALLDEVQTPAHSKQRFTVGY